MWKGIKESLGGRSETKIRDIEYENTKFTNISDMCEIFNKFSADSVNQIYEDGLETMVGIEPIMEDEFAKTMVGIEPIIEDEFAKILKKLKKYGSVDEVDVYIIEMAGNMLCEKIINVLNASFLKGVIPSEWKVIMVMPGPKNHRQVVETNVNEQLL
ncbi:hypothetical protein HHI36_003911 [Cryptolaemus montrouzieri]|uniref:Uncharacterized protein n=1 Tax=Cryptolaemus montrouzieri TaxID=559131 RepID=A0ABD2NQ96_9CUCU